MVKIASKEYKHKVLTGIGATVEEAFDELKKVLPYPIGNKAYKIFETFEKVLVDGSNLVGAVYTLNPGFKDTVAAKGTGSYKTPLEEEVSQYKL